MRRRPTLSDRLMFVAARHHAQSTYRRFQREIADATALQERVLLARIRRHADSAFGRDHHFDAIRSAADFARRVPVMRYEDHLPYIRRVMNGETGAMFGSGERVLMFAMTSGTVDEPKYIPVTTSFLAEYRRGWNVFGIKALLDHPAAFLRGICQVTSRMDEARSPAGIPCGAITGLMAATQKRLVRRYYVAPECVARISDPAAKYYTIMRLAVPSDVAFMITASPATQLKLARTAETHAQRIIRDVRDGTLDGSLDVPAEVRAALAPRLKPDREEAARLDRLATRHGRLLPMHYWHLEFLANWTGGTMGLHLGDLPGYFGAVPVRDIGLLASEGRISVPVADSTAAGILDAGGHFYEFVPAGDIDDALAGKTRPLRSHELEEGGEYFVLPTTSSGLYRYDLRDLIRVVGFEGQAPVIEFLGKGERICSLSGEKLTERQATLAMERVNRARGTRISNFVLAPQWDRPPWYLLHVDDNDAESAADIAAEMDAALGEINIEYRARRESDRLGPVRLNPLPRGFLADLDLQLAERYRRGNEQYKHQYLYSRPDQDAEFPRADAAAVNR